MGQAEVDIKSAEDYEKKADDFSTAGDDERAERDYGRAAMHRETAAKIYDDDNKYGLAAAQYFEAGDDFEVIAHINYDDGENEEAEKAFQKALDNYTKANTMYGLAHDTTGQKKADKRKDRILDKFGPDGTTEQFKLK